MTRARSDARSVACEVLRRVRKDDSYANLALNACLKRVALCDADRGLATELTYGVLRHQRLLDHVLGQLLRQPLERLEPRVLDILRCGAYQLLYLERIPRHAAVNEAVGAVRRIQGARLAGVVNAVLRKIDSDLLTRSLPKDPARRWAISASLPDELAGRLWAQLGEHAAEQFGKSLLERPPLTVRVNETKATREDATRALQRAGASVETATYSPVGLHIGGLVDPFATDMFANGMWSAQDEAAQLVGLLAQPEPHSDVLDLCAGLGGKTTHLAEQLCKDGNTETIVAVDNHAQKLKQLESAARRLGVAVETVCADMSLPNACRHERLAGRQFDTVLVDAPCSGIGVMRRHPELKLRWREGRMEQLVGLQRAILENAVQMLRPGGYVIYAVCTVTEDEGPNQISWLQQRFPELEPDHIRVPLVEHGVLRTWPHEHGVDGFFAARLRLNKGAS